MPSKLSRRKVLGMAAAGTATSAVAFAGVGLPTASPSSGQEGKRSGALRTTPARVEEVSGTTVRVTALTTAPSSDSWGFIPVVGFPWDLAPRPGDHVTVTEGAKGRSRHAAPLCSWVNSIPSRRDDSFVLNGKPTTPAAAIPTEPRGRLDRAAQSRRGVSTCLLTTDLAEAQVLQVREFGAPKPGAPAAPGK